MKQASLPATPADGGLATAAPTDALQRAPARAVWIPLGIVYIAWGSTYVGIRVMDRTIPPLLGAGVRFLAAGGVMFVVLAVWRRRLPRVARRELASLAVVSVLLLTGGNGVVTFAERHVPSGLAALLVASMPLWILVMRTLAGDRPRRATLGGLAIGFVGVGLLVLRGGQEQGVSVPHMLFVVGAALCWALGSWLAGRLPMPSDVTAGTAIEMLIGGAVLLGLSPLSASTGVRRRGTRPPIPCWRSATSRCSARSWRSPPTSGCSSTRRSRRSPPMPTSTRWSPWRSGPSCWASASPPDDPARRRRSSSSPSRW